jgi:hypothetical protein
MASSWQKEEPQELPLIGIVPVIQKALGDPETPG